MTPDVTRALELASRNDGYLAATGDPAVESLQRSGLVNISPVGDGYWIVRAVVIPSDNTRYYRGGNRWLRRAAEIGAAA
jgi:hypothetical protein